MTTSPVRTPTPVAPQRRRELGGWGVVMVAVGVLCAVTGAGLFVASAAVGWTWQQRDAAGFLDAGPASVSTDSSAVAVPDIAVDLRGPDVAYGGRLLGDVRVTATGTSADTPVFVGIGPTADVERYLQGVGHAVVTQVEVQPLRLSLRDTPGGPVSAAPTDQTFWAARDAGTGARSFTWSVAPGDWTVVVMNADGSAGVDARVTVGVNAPLMRWLTIGLVAGGVWLLGCGGALVLAPILARGRSVRRAP